ncbi:hypothetical protein Q4567_06320 [Aliiglaciecola sp. 2_MG-2023]|uniref:hypothetical protein n=1 Tax=unclassified Aliiglaciecola TaxID=2593648 RepID=UPI0026E388F6|nr:MULTISPECIES: hypothetical protein [unclassified Aliiglaciecola]MDO6710328.1 hypothetical protein [Aliiglaciecola sp. 2_MG-2023]MDO6751475.1 hypothetical protein [Aliiglaciecola sp. 1_MG-2023]
MKHTILLILTLLVSKFGLAQVTDEQRKDPLQSAILFKKSNICHAEYLGKTYDSMKVKANAGNTNYELKDTLTSCVEDGGRLDARYAHYFPDLSLLETQLVKAKQEERLDAVLKKTTIDPDEVKEAQEAVEIAKELEDKKLEEAKEAEEQEQETRENVNNFYGFNWAPGIAVMHYSESYIDDIRIESSGEGESKVNRVFIDKELDTNIAIVLETHYLWNVGNIVEGRDTGLGIFAATNLVKQEGSPLTTFAIGVMFAVRDTDSSSGISIGLAYFVDTDFKVLRDGLSDGSVTTYDDSAKVIRKVDESGLMLMVSSKF